MIIKIGKPGIYNKIIEIICRFIVKGNFSENSYTTLYHNIIAFSLFLYFDKNEDIYNCEGPDNKHLNSAYNTIKKFTIVILIRLLLSNNLNIKSLQHVLFPTLLGFFIYYIFIEKYIDQIIDYYNLNDNKLLKNLNILYPHIFESIIYEEFNNISLDLHSKDLLGRYLYKSVISEYIKFE